MQPRKGVKLDPQLIVAAFSRMDFSEAKESTQLAEEWHSSFDANDFAESMSNKLKKRFDNVITKYNFFTKIIAQLRISVRLIAELEMLRGFTHRDAMKSINLFLDYLSFYSTATERSTPLEQSVPENSSLAYFGCLLMKSNAFDENVTLFVDENLYKTLAAICGVIDGICQEYSVYLNVRTYTGTAKAPSWTQRTPVLVFEGSDLDSACEAIVGGAFSEQGVMPWSVNTVLVQENIMAAVVGKLKRHLGRVKFGRAVDMQTDFSVPILLSDYEAKLRQAVDAATAKGIEVYQAEGCPPAVMFVGGKVFSNSVVEACEARAPFINVLAFRGIKEAITLCGNQQQTYAVGVWANDVALVHEIAHNLDVNTIWINCHGVFHPSAPFSLDKPPTSEKHLKYNYTWAKKSQQERISILRNAVEIISMRLPVDAKNNMVTCLMETLLKTNIIAPQKSTTVQVHKSYELKRVDKPLGSVLVSTFEEAVSAMVLGNSVCLKQGDEPDSCAEFYDALAAFCGVFRLLPSNVNDVEKSGNFANHTYVWTAIDDNCC